MKHTVGMAVVETLNELEREFLAVSVRPTQSLDCGFMPDPGFLGILFWLLWN